MKTDLQVIYKTVINMFQEVSSKIKTFTRKLEILK